MNLLLLSSFTWNTETQESFTKLKHTLTTTLVLCLPKSSLPLAIEIDASGTTIGMVLSQNDHYIALFSKKLCSKMLTSFIYTREMFVVTKAVNE